MDNSDLEDFFTFLSFPSISSEPDYKNEMIDCAQWVLNYLQNIGFKTELWETSGHPVIFASNMEAGPNQPTVLIYNHYDVQPVDPLNEWHSQPFKPQIREGQVYARGAQDNKGQCFYTLHALKSLFERNKSFPINIKLCIEGEEECGSVGLSEVLKVKQKELKADYLAIVDLGIPAPNIPSITLGIRGIVTMDVEVFGSKTDMHSGSNGGLLYNPIHALTELLAKLRDPSGKITIPGFYEDVVPFSEKERSQISWEFDDKKYQATFGVLPTGGEHQLPPLERNWIRPTLEINGISGGYSGSGFKTVIPAKASAKISCRIVQNQDPQKIGTLVAAFLEKHAPPGIQIKVSLHHGGKAVRSNPDSKVVQAFAQAFSETFKKPCRFIFEGASIPIVTELAEASQSEVVLLGLGLADDQIHAPNEHFGLDRLEKGSTIMMRAINLFRN